MLLLFVNNYEKQSYLGSKIARLKLKKIGGIFLMVEHVI